MQAEQTITAVPTRTLIISLFLSSLLIALAVVLSAWLVTREPQPAFATPYQAVLLGNGQVYYGRLSGFGTKIPVLREVYYIQQGVNPQTKEATSVLLRRGREWHAPDVMYLTPQQIVLVEPVGPNSKVADLIKELRSAPK